MTRLLKIFKIYLVISVAASGLYIFMAHIFFNPTISLRRGYYFAYQSQHYSVGDTVLICVVTDKYVRVLRQLHLPVVTDACANGTPYLLKRIVAVGGDRVLIDIQGVSVNGELQPNSRALNAYQQIHLLPSAFAQYELGANQFFVLGETAHSYDSRYFGVLIKSQIMGIAWLIWPRDTPLW